MIVFTLLVLLISHQHIIGQSWNISDGILPWESYIRLVDIQRPLGLTLNQSSLAHHHFAIGYLCLHSFMYDEAQQAFNLAINVTPTFIEPYIGKMLACKHALWSDTDFECGLSAYNATKTMLTTSNITLSPLQSSLLTTVYQWYANQSSITTGELAFLSSIGNVTKIYPNETDIRVLWGLSLLNVAYQHEFDGEMEPEPMIKAREVLRSVLKDEATHPGALHYLIHAYDIAQSNISEQAIDYVNTYQNLASTLSYAKQLPARIWMRTGSIKLAKQSTEASLQASLSLCLIKIIGRNISISSNQLDSVLTQLNTANQVQSFLLCDARNRATALEWLSFSRLQTGDWLGTLSPINDLYITYNRSIPPAKIYLSYAYRTRARAVINLFYWLPYDIQFSSKAGEIQRLYETLDLITTNDNITDGDLAWSEAGYRLSSCLRLLTNQNASYSDPTIKPTIDEHLARFTVLANQTASLNKYISISISLMSSQIYGVIHFQNESFQQCLNLLNDAAQREFDLVMGYHSPALIYARSSELLAMHLLLIYRKYQQSSNQTNLPTFILNGTQISVSEFPRYALALYQNANLSAPNRAINILGMARANSQLRYNNIATKYYRMLLDQISSSNISDPIFSQEAFVFIAQNQDINNSANRNQFYCLLNLSYFMLFYFLFIN